MQRKAGKTRLLTKANRKQPEPSGGIVITPTPPKNQIKNREEIQDGKRIKY